MLGWWHRRFGLVVGAVIAFQALTGAILAAASLITHEAPTPVPPGLGIDLDAAVARAEQFGSGTVVRVDLPTVGNRAYTVRMRDDDGTLLVAVIDGAMGLASEPMPLLAAPLSFLARLHHDWFAGDAGNWALAVVGVIGLGLLGTGLFIWWPRAGDWRRALSVVGRRGGIAYWLSLHRVIGALSLVLVLPVLLSGTALALRGPIQGLFAEPLPAPAADEPTAPPPLEALVAKAREAVGDMHPKDVRLRNDTVLVVMKAAGTFHTGRVWLSRSTGEILRTHDPGTAPANVVVYDFLLRLHDGVILSRLGIGLVLLAGVAVLGSYGAGVALWLRRRRRKAPSARQPARNGDGQKAASG